MTRVSLLKQMPFQIIPKVETSQYPYEVIAPANQLVCSPWKMSSAVSPYGVESSGEAWGLCPIGPSSKDRYVE